VVIVAAGGAISGPLAQGVDGMVGGVVGGAVGNVASKTFEETACKAV
jgi:hypothetical protein